MTLPSLKPSYDYIPGLNGLRAVAVLLVLVAHLGFSHMVPGGFGVTLFFFISGMLITRLLLAEYDTTHTINIKQFYIRRFLRLYPALIVAIILGSFIFWLATHQINYHKLFAAFFYYINFYGIYVGFGQDWIGFDPLSILWSLAIEEQYYVIFPLLVLPLIQRKRNLFICLLLLTCIVVIWRSYLHFDGASSDLIYMRSDTRIDSILYGSLLTLILSSPYAATWVKYLSNPLLFVCGIIVILISFIIRDDNFRDTIRYTVQGIALFPILTTICFSKRLTWLTQLLEWRPFREIGAWSYSLYLFHPIAILIAEMMWGPGSLGKSTLPLNQYLGFVITAAPLAFIFAITSYYCVEKPVMRLRHRFGSHIKSV